VFGLKFGPISEAEEHSSPQKARNAGRPRKRATAKINRRTNQKIEIKERTI
jgi:hypothetical protein